MPEPEKVVYLFTVHGITAEGNTVKLSGTVRGPAGEPESVYEAALASCRALDSKTRYARPVLRCGAKRRR